MAGGLGQAIRGQSGKIGGLEKSARVAPLGGRAGSVVSWCIVTGGDTTQGYNVALLDASLAASSTTFEHVRTVPLGTELEVGARLLLVFESPSDPAPVILAASGTGSVGNDYKCQVSLINGDGTVELNVLDWEDYETIYATVSNVPVFPPGPVAQWDYGWLKYNPLASSEASFHA